MRTVGDRVRVGGKAIDIKTTVKRQSRVTVVLTGAECDYSVTRVDEPDGAAQLWVNPQPYGVTREAWERHKALGDLAFRAFDEEMAGGFLSPLPATEVPAALTVDTALGFPVHLQRLAKLSRGLLDAMKAAPLTTRDEIDARENVWLRADGLRVAVDDFVLRGERWGVFNNDAQEWDSVSFNCWLDRDTARYLATEYSERATGRLGLGLYESRQMVRP